MSSFTNFSEKFWFVVEYIRDNFLNKQYISRKLFHVGVAENTGTKTSKMVYYDNHNTERVMHFVSRHKPVPLFEVFCEKKDMTDYVKSCMSPWGDFYGQRLCFKDMGLIGLVTVNKILDDSSAVFESHEPVDNFLNFLNF